MELKGKERQFFKKEAHNLKPIFQIGKGGLSEEMMQQIAFAIEKRELIKVSLLQNTMEEPNEAAQAIAQATNSTVIQVIGHTIVLYRPARNPKNRDLSIRFAEFQKRGRNNG